MKQITVGGEVMTNEKMTDEQMVEFLREHAHAFGPSRTLDALHQIADRIEGLIPAEYINVYGHAISAEFLLGTPRSSRQEADKYAVHARTHILIRRKLDDGTYNLTLEEV